MYKPHLHNSCVPAPQASCFTGTDPPPFSSAASPPSLVDQDVKEALASKELEEGLVFRLGTESIETLFQVPDSVRDEVTALLQQYRALVFQEWEFPL